jgi:hypothetical protein
MFTGRIGSCPPSEKPVDIILMTLFIPQEFCAAVVMDTLRARLRDCSALHLALFCWSAAYLPSLIYGRILIGVWHLIRRQRSR